MTPEVRRLYRVVCFVSNAFGECADHAAESADRLRAAGLGLSRLLFRQEQRCRAVAWAAHIVNRHMNDAAAHLTRGDR